MRFLLFRRSLMLSLGILALSGSSAPAWRAAPDMSVISVALNGAGDVIAVGAETGASETDAVVVKRDGASGNELWRVTVDGSAAFSNDIATRVAVNAAGDVYVAGLLDNTGTGEDLFVIKLAGGTGAELWRVVLDGTASGDDRVGGVAVIAGDVLVSGTLDNGNDEATVRRLAAATGAEVWRYDVVGTAGSSGAAGVQVDGAADVVVGLGLVNLVTGGDVGVAKLDGATGAELWRYELTTPVGPDGDFIAGTALDPAGDVVVLSDIGAEQYSSPVTVTKLDGATGAEVWQTTAVGGCGTYESGADIAVDASGNPVITGLFGEPDPICQQGFSVMKFDGATGARLWWHPVTDMMHEPSSAGGVEVDSADDVVATGTTYKRGNSFNQFHTAVKLDGATGDEQWRQVLDVIGSPFALALDTQDNAVFGREGLFELSGLSGAVGPTDGVRLQVKDYAGQPNRRAIGAMLVDPVIKTAPAGSAGDPRVSGAVLTLVNPATLESASFSLPPAGWEGIGPPPGARGYRYTDTAGAYGPCRRITLKPKRLTLQCSGRTGTIPFTLDEPSQGALTVSLTIGSSEGHCATFGGEIRRDAGTANPGPAGLFSGRAAPASSGGCP